MMNNTVTVVYEDDYYFTYLALLLILIFMIVFTYNAKIENLLLEINTLETKYDIDSQVWEQTLENVQEDYDSLKEEYDSLKEKYLSQVEYICKKCQIIKNVEI